MTVLIEQSNRPREKRAYRQFEFCRFPSEMGRKSSPSRTGSVTAAATGSALFVLARDRDAWATIRGFVYQVELSILRWLQLVDGEALELERGEDIDHITTALAGDAIVDGRLLEQIKHRVAPITLRSGPAREALANFSEHRRANATTVLRFRFTTTAQVGRETKSPIPGKVPGITAWQGIAQQTIEVSQQPAVLAAIRALLRTTDRPDTVPNEVWAAYQAWLDTAPDDTLRDFVRSVEWATAMPDSESLVPTIIAALRRECPGVGDEELHDKYQRLFVGVFSRLARSGVKQITRPDLLAELAPGTAFDHALVEHFRTLHTLLAVRVEVLEQRLDALDADVSSTKADVLALSAQLLGVTLGSQLAQYGPSAAIDATRVLSPPLTEPPFATHSSPRAQVVHSLLPPGEDQHASPIVIALYGANASGKTQLALRLAHAGGPRRTWIPFFGLSPEESGSRLVLAIHTIASRIAGGDRRGVQPWEEACATAVASLDVLVLDDITEFRSGDAFGSRLRGLLDAAYSASTLIIITSVTPIAGLHMAGEPGRVINRVVPPLDSDEVSDVLRSRRAPASVVASGAPELLRQTTNGHPVLVQAIADYLERNEWAFTSQFFADAFGQRYATAVNEQTVRTLLGTVSDDATREYLYRLTIAAPEFEADDAVVLAEVPPPINRARERFSSVVGPWVEPIGNARYRLSQLVRALGATDLPTETRRNCHRTLGERILARRRLNELDALQAITHFTGAGDFDRAALLVLQGLHSLAQADELPAHTLQVWRSLLVAPQASAPLRLQIHAFQAVLSQRAGESPANAVASMEAILRADEIVPAWAVFASSLAIVQGLALDNVPVAATFMRRALEAWTQMPDDLRQSLRVRRREIDIGVETIVWLVSGGVRNATDLRAWLEALADLPAETRQRALNTPVARQMSSAVLHRILLAEWERPVESRDWRRAAAILEETADAARALQAPGLEAAAIASQLTCLHEARADLAAVTTVAERGLTTFSTDPDSAFLIARHMAFGVLDRGEVATSPATFNVYHGMSR